MRVIGLHGVTSMKEAWMDGPEHSFMVINSSELDDGECFWCKDTIPWDTALKFPDDLFSYFFDSFEWVEVENPDAGNKKIPFGHNRWSSSVVRGDGAMMMLKIISSWKALFVNAPMKFSITGSYICDQDDDGHYEEIKIYKQDLIDTLSELESMLNVIIESNGEKCLYCSGI